MKKIISEIKNLAGGINLLYVEDNAGLRDNMSKLLNRIFDNIILAEDGEDGYRNFIKNRPNIVITDINMPKMNGFKMIQKIKVAEPECKIIVLSAYDEKEHLHLAIDLGVFRYLHKPAKLPELVQAIYDSVLAINKEKDHCIFLNQVQNIFNYQHSMVVMMHEKKFILSNQRFLEFFNVDNLEDFTKKYENHDALLQKHKEFLYSTPDSKWQDVIVKNSGKLFHTKIKNYKDEMHHLILKSREIPEKDDCYVLSFDDVTELNLMRLFDSDTAKSDLVVQDKKSVITFMKIVKENSAKVKIHNFYKGLTIVNPAVISDITDEEVTFKTAYSQLRIVQLTKFMTISSEIFPKSVICKSIKEVDLDKQTITINEMSFAPRSSADRQYIRLEPEENHSCTLFHQDIKFSGDVKIIDISQVSAKIELNALPPGMKVDNEVKISIVLTLNTKPISITTDAKIYRIDENIRSYYIVVKFELPPKEMNNIKNYLSNRQMSLIREFKKLNIT